MSHNKHYTNYSKPQETEKSVVAPEGIQATPVEPEVAPVVTPEETPVVPTEPEVTPEEPVAATIGKVIDCKKLRVRKSPSAIASVLCEIKADSEVTIDLQASTVEFYKVCTGAGVEGYCMKKYIAVV